MIGVLQFTEVGSIETPSCCWSTIATEVAVLRFSRFCSRSVFAILPTPPITIAVKVKTEAPPTTVKDRRRRSVPSCTYKWSKLTPPRLEEETLFMPIVDNFDLAKL